MNINATLLGQLFSFFIFVWICKQYIWPPIIKHMEVRQAKIAAGLRDAERAEHELKIAKEKAQNYVIEAKNQAGKLIEEANKRAANLIEEAREKANLESKRIKQQAAAEIESRSAQVKEELRKQVVALSLLGAEKIIQQQIDANQHEKMLLQVAEQL
jgi:F-type H+-transporting ATPase subunit b